jgi:hypothetical protein
MTIFLVLAPYGAFTLLMLLTSAMVSAFAASLVCLVTIAIDLVRGRSVKILAAGSAILFAAIGVYLALIDPAPAASKVKLAADAGVFIIMAGSMLVRFPFTLQYALESVPAETAAMPGFLRANYTITAVWIAASLLMMLSTLALVYVPDLPIWTSLLIVFAARNSALYFTKWYPQYREQKYALVAALPTAH